MSEPENNVSEPEGERIEVSKVRLWVAQELKRLGFPYEIEPDESYPADSKFKALPIDMTTATDDELGALLGYFTKWAAKAREWGTLHKMDADAYDELVTRTYNKAYSTSKGTNKKVDADLNEHVAYARGKRARSRAASEILFAKMQGFVDAYNTVRTELYRRQKLLS